MRLVKRKIRITWNDSQGGELHSVTVTPDHHNNLALTTALIELVRGAIVSPGDSFTVQEIEA